MDAQQDHTEGDRELQNHARAEGISADIEDKIEGKYGKAEQTRNGERTFPLSRTKRPHLATFVVLLYQNRRTIMETMNSFPKYGLQLMSDEYILENFIEKLRETR